MSSAILSKRQAEVLNFLKSFSKDKGYSPSLKEIGVEFGISVSAAQQHVRTLVLKGFISKEQNIPRSITFKEDETEKRTVSLPVLGTISAGSGVEVFEESSPQLVEVNRELINHNFIHYCLQVKGDSMISEGIMDQDIVIVRQQNIVDNGEIAVAILKGDFEEKATLKMFYNLGSVVELRPRNPNIRTIRAKPEEVEIRGKFVGLIRS